MTLFKNKYRIESTRLKNWDYSAAGFYFVTICTRGRGCFFGDVVDGEAKLTEIGAKAKDFWEEIPSHFAHARLDKYVVMPNHMHGIVVLDNHNVETRHGASLPNRFGPLKAGSLSAIIHAYKASVTRWGNKNGHRYFSWQPRFYEHIVRNEEDLNRIRKYIAENPLKWELDKESAEGIWM
jgi:REP element-mobilizing transposase RayT